jgi:hypothetical protein
LRRATPQKTGLSAAIFFAAVRQKRISAAIQDAWASNRVVRKPQFPNNFPGKREFAAMCGKFSKT